MKLVLNVGFFFLHRASFCVLPNNRFRFLAIGLIYFTSSVKSWILLLWFIFFLVNISNKRFDLLWCNLFTFLCRFFLSSSQCFASNATFFSPPSPSALSSFLLHLLLPSLMEAKRSQSISNCVHLYEALPAAKSVPMLLHTVNSILPGISSGNSACSHRLSGKLCCESRVCCPCVLTFVPSICSHDRACLQ